MFRRQLAPPSRPVAVLPVIVVSWLHAAPTFTSNHACLGYWIAWGGSVHDRTRCITVRLKDESQKELSYHYAAKYLFGECMAVGSLCHRGTYCTGKQQMCNHHQTCKTPKHVTSQALITLSTWYGQVVLVSDPVASPHPPACKQWCRIAGQQYSCFQAVLHAVHVPSAIQN